MIKIYTDGSCRGNGKEDSTGGYGIVIFKDNVLIDYCCYQYKCENITNNKMELLAILHAFEIAQMPEYKNEICIVYTDSSYCERICNDWIYKWARNNWKKKDNKDIENLSFIQSLYKYLNIDFFNCQVKKCDGHIGILGNELADALATNNIERFNKIIKDNNIKFD